MGSKVSSGDETAYKCVKAMKWIIENADSKEQANDILATLQGSEAHKLMSNIAGYDGLHDKATVRQVPTT